VTIRIRSRGVVFMLKTRETVSKAFPAGQGVKRTTERDPTSSNILQLSAVSIVNTLNHGSGTARSGELSYRSPGAVRGFSALNSSRMLLLRREG
jgi:hypothetical protein